MRVETLFPKMKENQCLQKMSEFQEEIGIFSFSSKPPSPLGCKEELNLLRDIEKKTYPHHITMIRSFISQSVMKNAKKTHIKKKYRIVQKQIRFLESAVQEIQEYDPFYLSMDDIHESDMMLSTLMLRAMYYEEVLRS